VTLLSFPLNNPIAVPSGSHHNGAGAVTHNEAVAMTLSVYPNRDPFGNSVAVDDSVQLWVGGFHPAASDADGRIGSFRIRIGQTYYRAELRFDAGKVEVCLPPGLTDPVVGDGIKQTVLRTAETSAGFQKRLAKIQVRELRRAEERLGQVLQLTLPLKPGLTERRRVIAEARAALDEAAFELTARGES
jgi:hypothetical protein